MNPVDLGDDEVELLVEAGPAGGVELVPHIDQAEQGHAALGHFPLAFVGGLLGEADVAAGFAFPI